LVHVGSHEVTPPPARLIDRFSPFLFVRNNLLPFRWRMVVVKILNSLPPLQWRVAHRNAFCIFFCRDFRPLVVRKLISKLFLRVSRGCSEIFFSPSFVIYYILIIIRCFFPLSLFSLIRIMSLPHPCEALDHTFLDGLPLPPRTC